MVLHVARSGGGDAVGAPSATPPMLLPLRQWGVDQVLWLPGTSGNYASIPDVNLLDADTAHSEQGIPWGTNNNLVSPPVQSTDISARFGQFVGKMTSAAGGTFGAYGPSPTTSGPKVTVGQQYTASAWVYSPTAQSVRMDLSWRDSSDIVIGATIGSAVALAADTWTQVSVTGTAPLLADHALMTLRGDTLSATSAGTVLYFDTVCLRTGSDPTFVPSTRIVGDLDIRWNGAVGNTTTEQIFVAKDDGSSNRSYHFGIRSYDAIRFGTTIADGTTDVYEFPAGHIDLTTREPIGIRVTRVAADGTNSLYELVDDQWDLKVSAVRQVGSLKTIGQPVNIGAFTGTIWPFHGSMEWFEIRDGIDGPIVASADFTNPAEVTGDNWTTPEGHAASITRSGDATAELVDRACWAFTGAEYLQVPARDSLAAMEALSAFTILLSRATVTTAAVASGVIGENRWYLGLNGGSANDPLTFTVSFAGGTSAASLPPGDSDDGQWHAIVGRYDNGTNDAKNDVGGTDTDTTLDQPMPTTGVVYMGAVVAGAQYKVLVPVVAVFDRRITDEERDELLTWDGSVANEPAWLRSDPKLVLYLNADDDDQVAAYELGDVANIRSRLVEASRALTVGV